MNTKKVLAIFGSPHTNGMTAAMLEDAIYAAERKGYCVTKVNLYEKNIGYCTGCRACFATECCVIKDDMQAIAALLKECHIVILAAPVYWANVPACVKNFFDRSLGVAMEETNTFPKPRLSGKKYVILTSCNTPAPFSWIFGQSRGAIRNIDEFFKTAGMKAAGKIVCANAAKRSKLPKAVHKKIEKCWK